MSKGKILFVEDDPETANMLRLYFESQGYEVMQASWGRDGIEMSRRTPPDLVVLDIRLPDIDGYEVCRELRRNWRTSQTPIIFLTERRERNDRIAGLRLGAVDYLTKPFDVQELRLRVRNALNRARFESLVDPITALPGGKLLDARLKELLERQGWTILLVTIGGLEEFSARYGFVAGNEVLRATALVLGKAVDSLGSVEDFVGDPGSGSFIIITTTESATGLRDHLVSELQQTLSLFYPAADRRSFLEPADKDSGNAERAVPVLTISVGTVLETDADFQDVKDIVHSALTNRTTVALVPDHAGG